MLPYLLLRFASRMADPTPPAPTPAPGDNSPNKSPLELNAAQAAAVKKAEDICKRALMPEYLPTFIAQGEVQAEIVALQGQCKDAREFASQAMQKTTEKHLDVDATQTAEEGLIQTIQFFQKKARRKYARSKTPEVLKDYFVGARLENNRDNLLQYANAIALKITTDVLPGVSAADQQRLADAITAFTAPDPDAVQGKATGLREQLQGAAETHHGWPDESAIHRRRGVAARRPAECGHPSAVLPAGKPAVRDAGVRLPRHGGGRITQRVCGLGDGAGADAG